MAFPLESCHLSHQNGALSVKEKHHKLWKNLKQKSNWRKSLHFYLFYKGFYNWTLFRTNFVECRHIISKTNVHLCNKFTLNLLQFWISMYNNGEKLHFQSHVFIMEEDKYMRSIAWVFVTFKLRNKFSIMFCNLYPELQASIALYADIFVFIVWTYRFEHLFAFSSTNYCNRI